MNLMGEPQIADAQGLRSRRGPCDVPKPTDLFGWRNAIMSELGPGNPLARLVLMTVGLHMKVDGSGAWPSQALIAARAHVGLRTVKRHLESADRHGWIERRPMRRSGQRWRGTEYAACIPDEVYALLRERPWETDPMFRRGAAVAPSYHNKVPLVQDVMPPEPEAGATNARRGANGDRDVGPKLGLLTLPLNSSENSTKNSSDEGALARTSPVKGFSNLKSQDEDPEQRITRIRRYLQKFPQYREEPETIAKLAKVSCEEVLRVRDN